VFAYESNRGRFSMENDQFGPLAYEIDRACAVSGLGRSKVYELIGERRLKAKKCGRKTLILRADLEAFLESLPGIAAGRSEDAKDAVS
jgi:excisionase family DNA binding protein